MTVAVDDAVDEYLAVGGEPSFTYTFPVNTVIAPVLHALVVETRLAGVLTTLVEGVDYTVTGAGNPLGGTALLDTGVFPSGAIAGVTWELKRVNPISRVTDFQTAGDFFATEVNTQLDLITQILQDQLRDQDANFANSIRLADSSLFNLGTMVDPISGTFLRAKADKSFDWVTVAVTGTSTSIDETDTDATKNKLVSNLLGFGWENSRYHISIFDFLSLAEIAQVDAGLETIDLTPKFVQAIAIIDAKGGGTLWSPEGLYSHTNLFLPDNIVLDGVANASIFKLRNAANTTQITASGKSGIGIQNLVFDGNEANQTGSAMSTIIWLAPTIDVGNFTLQNCEIRNTRNSAFRAVSTNKKEGLRIIGNKLNNIGTAATIAHAIFLNEACPGAILSQNHINTTGANGNGIWVGNESDLVIISDNHIKNCGDMGIEYFNNSIGGAYIGGNTMDNTAAFGISVGISPNCTVIGNVIRDATTLGIELTLGDHLTCLGNTVIDIGQKLNSGIIINKTSHCTVNGNAIDGVGNAPGDQGIRIFADGASKSDFNNISNNVIKLPLSQTDVTGIAMQNNAAGSSCSFNKISGNTIEGNGSLNTKGFVITDPGNGNCTDNIISGNLIKSCAIGVNIAGSNVNNTRLKFNDYISNTVDITDTGTDTIIEEETGGKGADIASAATITVGKGKIFDITGVTTITSVTASWAGREIILQFDGVLTFTDGSNLKLSGNFVTTADDVIALYCDGTDWFERSRSVN